MKVEFKKDWKCYTAPNGIFKKGEVVDLSPANTQTVISNGYGVKYNEREVKQISHEKVETSMKKNSKETR
jgi:Tfp pilus assembly protein PilZ